MAARIPDDVIYAALRDLDDPGNEAADWFACGFEQARSGGDRAGNFVAYCGREALMALLLLGGVRVPGLGEAVDRVVSVADRLSADDAGDPSELLEAIGALKEQREGPGPHRHRLGTLIFEMTHRQSVAVKQDLFDSYVETLDGLNGLVHSGTRASLDDARTLLDEAFAIAGRLFAPISVRFDAIDALVALETPTTEDVQQLLGWIGDPRILSYFFSRAEAVGWFEVLAEHELLSPPEDVGYWPALVFMRKLGETHPERVKEWLARRPSGSELTTQQAFHFLQLARSVRAPVDSELLRLLKGHFANPTVLTILSAYVQARPTEGQDASATLGLMKQALDAASGRDAFGGGGYLVGVLLRRAVALAEEAEAERWLGVICAKTRDMFGPNAAMGRWAIQRLQPIPRLHVDAGTQVLEQFVAAIRDLLRVAARARVTPETRRAKLRRLPAPLDGRLIATDLIAEDALDLQSGLTLLTEEVSAGEAMPETLALLRRLREADADGLSTAMKAALGSPPDTAAVEQLGDDEQIPRRWGDVYGWSAEMPPDAIAAWRPAIDVCRSRWGEPSPDGAILPPPVAVFAPEESPYRGEELQELPVVEAATKVGEWTPGPSEDFGPNRHGLANVLKQAIEADRTRWLSADGAEIVRALARPVYLTAYFGSLKSTPDQALPISVLAAIEEAASLYELDRCSHALDREGPPWSAVLTIALPLLTRLDLGDGESQTRAWSLLDSIADPEEPADLEGPTIYGAVIGTAIGIADMTSTRDEPPTQFVELMNSALVLKSPIADLVRQTLGANLSWLVSRFPSWTDDHWDLLVGTEAVDNLGVYTFEAYLARGRPFTDLLLRCRDRIWDSMATTPAAAQVHILHGMLWDVDGYDPPTVVSKLAAVSDTAVSDAARWLAAAVTRSTGLDVGPIRAFWGSAVRTQLPSKQYEGFGQFALAEEFDDEAWLDLSLAAARLCPSGLALPEQVAQRAAELANHPRALRLIAALLHSKLELWQVFEVGRLGVESFRTTRASDTEAKAELRERLLEREFYEVRADT